MPHTHHLQRTGAGRECQRGGQGGACCCRGAGHIGHVEGVEGALELAQQSVATTVGVGQAAHHAQQHLHIEAQAEHVVVAQREVGPLHVVDRPIGGCIA